MFFMNILHSHFDCFIVCQVCAPERKKHAAYTGAGGKKAEITNAKSRTVKKGMMLKLHC